MPNIGKAISDLRAVKGWTSELLAEKLKKAMPNTMIDGNMINRYESGDLACPADMIAPLCLLFEITPNDLLGFDTDAHVTRLYQKLESMQDELKAHREFMQELRGYFDQQKQGQASPKKGWWPLGRR